jgi:hypothetical protein
MEVGTNTGEKQPVAATGLLASHHQSHRRLSSSGRASQTPFPLPCCYVRLSRLIDSCASVRVNRCIFHAYARANRSHRHICLSPLKFFLLHGVCICTYIDCCLPENKREREKSVVPSPAGTNLVVSTRRKLLVSTDRKC